MGARFARPPPDGRLPINQLVSRVQIGDLVLISSTVALEPDLYLPPRVAHEVEYTTRNFINLNRFSQIPQWDSAAIVVKSTLDRSNTKYLLEWTPNGFIMSEVRGRQLLGRLSEFKKLKWKVAVRFLSRPESALFEEPLRRLCEDLNGMTFAELPSVHPIQVLNDRVLRAQVTPPLNSTMLQHLEQVFHVFSDDSTDLKVSRTQFNDFMRELVGVHLDLSDEEISHYFKFNSEISFDQFLMKWVEKDGKKRIEGELFTPSAYQGQLLFFVYTQLKVLEAPESDFPDVLIPDDFTSFGFDRAFKHSGLRVNQPFMFEPEQEVAL